MRVGAAGGVTGLDIAAPLLKKAAATPEIVSQLQDTFDIVGSLGEVCELDVVTTFLDRPEIATLVRRTLNMRLRLLVSSTDA